MPLCPVLVIGLGGSGTKVVQTVQRRTLERLRECGWRHDSLPPQWKMLSIDVVADGSEDRYPAPPLSPKDRIGLLSTEGRFGLIHRSVPYSALRESLKAIVPPDQQYDRLESWMPERHPGGLHPEVDFSRRAVNRVVVLSALTGLRASLAETIAPADAETPSPSLAEAAACLGQSGISTTRRTWLVGSLVGGFGSGALLDIVDLLGELDPDGIVATRVLLFGSDVFRPIQALGNGATLASNALAAMAEVAAHASATWLANHGSVDDTPATTTNASPILGRRDRGPEFLVGVTDGNGDTIGVLDEAFQRTGERLTAAIVGANGSDGLGSAWWTSNGASKGSVAHEALMAPVAEALSASRGWLTMSRTIWAQGRARPLLEAIPATRIEIHDLATGWVAAGLLGVRRSEVGAGSGMTHARVWDIRQECWADFPRPLFDPVVTGFAVLPAVLASIPLALVDVHATQSHAPLAPYLALMDFSDVSSDGPLGRWLRDGRTVAECRGLVPDPNKAGTNEMSIEERTSRVRARILRDLSLFEDHCRITEEARHIDLALELRSVIRAAYATVLSVTDGSTRRPDRESHR